MSDPLKFGLAIQAGIGAVLVLGSRLNILRFEVAPYAFLAFVAVGILTAAFYRFGKSRLIIGAEAVSWGVTFGVHMVSAVVFFWIVRALAE